MNKIGDVTKKYESGSRGTTSVSQGDSKGGSSYGTYQLSSKAGTFKKFINWAKKKGKNEEKAMNEILEANKLDKLEYPKNSDFNHGSKSHTAKIWRIKAKAEDIDLSSLEHEYIKNTHYDPVERIWIKNGYNTDSGRIKEVIWSSSVQHSKDGNEKILNNTISEVGLDCPEDEFIKTFYKKRGDYVINHTNLKRHEKENIVNKRYKDEPNDILKMEDEIISVTVGSTKEGILVIENVSEIDLEIVVNTNIENIEDIDLDSSVNINIENVKDTDLDRAENTHIEIIEDTQVEVITKTHSESCATSGAPSKIENKPNSSEENYIGVINIINKLLQSIDLI